MAIIEVKFQKSRRSSLQKTFTLGLKTMKETTIPRKPPQKSPKEGMSQIQIKKGNSDLAIIREYSDRQGEQELTLQEVGLENPIKGITIVSEKAINPTEAILELPGNPEKDQNPSPKAWEGL